MTKPTEKLTAREFVWVHRIRQRVIFERIVLSVGNPAEKLQAQQFLEAMEQAHPGLLEDIDQYAPEFLEGNDSCTPELFDNSEYSKAGGRKTAFKLPKDILWEERVVRRAAREYRDLFHPCENVFDNAMKGLQYLSRLHSELFARARVQALEQREQVLSFEIYCPCDCTTPESREPADSFKNTSRGRFEKVSRRISSARRSLETNDDNGQSHWQFFLDRIGEVAPEMLES